MKISEQLKRNLLADVENICELSLNEETKESLMRCFEITIATHYPEFNLSLIKKLFYKNKQKKCSHGFNLEEVLTRKGDATCKLCGKKLSELTNL